MHVSSFHSTHLCMPNVCGNNNVYKTQTCASLYYLNDSTDYWQCTGRWCCRCTAEDELRTPDPRRSLASDIPFHAIEQANQEVRQDDCHSQHTSNQASNT